MQREKREHITRNYRSKFGKSTIDIECPFCDKITRAYVWSLAGGGKKCECGALHTRYGTLAPIKK